VGLTSGPAERTFREFVMPLLAEAHERLAAQHQRQAARRQ